MKLPYSLDNMLPNELKLNIRGPECVSVLQQEQGCWYTFLTRRILRYFGGEPLVEPVCESALARQTYVLDL